MLRRVAFLVAETGLLLVDDCRHHAGLYPGIADLAVLEGLHALVRRSEGRDQRVGQYSEFTFVDRRYRIHHHEEREQQRNEICIGNVPALVIFMLFVFWLTCHRRAFSKGPTSKSNKNKKPKSLVSMLRGFSPSAI